MSSDSRTGKSLKNAQIALVFYALNLILQFFSRKLFLDYLGTEVLGLNTTIMNLLQFLNLAELGIGEAVSYSLYKPLAKKDWRAVTDIVSVQGYLYRKVGYTVLAASGVLMLFLPWIFAKAAIPLWYAYATFVILLISVLSGYFYTYAQIVFTADQKNYKITSITQSLKLLKVCLQMFAIYYLSQGYVWWLGLELVSVPILIILINRTIKGEYPWLKPNLKMGKKINASYEQIITKTKQLFFHRIAGFVLFQSSSLIIYAYASLTLVALYGNYMLIVTGVIALLNAIFYSISASVGNLVAEGDRVKILRIFKELFSVRFLIVATVCFGVYTMADSFISLWVGKQYQLDHLTLLLIVTILYINTIRQSVDSFIYAYGMFSDIWAPIVEASINISLSILFGYFWGLHGILLGVLVSLFIIVFCWKPYFLFTRGLQQSIMIYIQIYVKHLLIGGVSWWVALRVAQYLPFASNESFWMFACYGIIVVSCFMFILGSLAFAFERGMRDCMYRMLKLINR